MEPFASDRVVAEAEYVVTSILANRELGMQLKEQAVLFRGSHHSDRLELELVRCNIPYVKYGGLKFLEAAHVKDFAIRLTLATHPEEAGASERVRRYVRHGASPRGLIAMIMAAKATAFQDGRLNVSFDDLKANALAALRHRLLLNFEGEADGVAVDDLIQELVDGVPVAPGVAA